MKKTTREKENRARELTRSLPLRPTSTAIQDDYAFVYDSEFVYDTPLCSYLTADELVVKSTTGDIFVTTHIDHKKIYREPQDSEDLCPETPDNSPGVSKSDGAAGGFTYANGICTYQTNTNLFPVGVEEIQLNILHGYSTLSGNYDASTNPKTYIRRKGDDANYKTIEGEDIKLTVAELMEIAGVDLDETFDNQPNGVVPATGLQANEGKSTGVFPRPRLTGVRVALAINYYNYNLDDLEGSELGTSDIYAVVEVESQLAWTSRGQDVRYRSLPSDWTSPVNEFGKPNGALEDMYVYGINIVVNANGVVAAFNFQLFITTIVSGLVFLGVAKNIVDFVAMYGLGVKSKLLKSFIQEEVNLEEECARFSLTALMASEFFKKKDADGSGQLDLTEIQDMLRETFNAKAEEGDKEEGVMELSDTEIASLALYILRTCDEDRDELRLEGKEKGLDDLASSSISLREFINISSSSNVTVKALKEIVELTNLDEMVEDEEAKTGQAGLSSRTGMRIKETPAEAEYPAVPEDERV